MNLMRHAIRIGPAWLRCPLVSLAWADHFSGYALRSLLLGRKVSLPFALSVFYAAWDGAFVPSRR